MLELSHISDLSLNINFPIFLYNKDFGNLFIYTLGSSKEIETPPVIDKMISEELSKFVTGKNDNQKIFRSINIDQTYSIFFQDLQDESRLNQLLSELLKINYSKTSYSSKDTLETNEPDEQTQHQIKTQNIQISTLHTKVEYLKNDITLLKTEVEKKNKTIAILNHNIEKYDKELLKIKSLTETLNFNKLQKINKELREESTLAKYSLTKAEDNLKKTKEKSVQAILKCNLMLRRNPANMADISDIISILTVQQPAATSQFATTTKGGVSSPDITKIVDKLNFVIKRNDYKNIDVLRVCAIAGISNTALVMAQPSIHFKEAIPKLIGMARSNNISYRDLLSLYSALNIEV